MIELNSNYDGNSRYAESSTEKEERTKWKQLNGKSDNRWFENIILNNRRKLLEKFNSTQDKLAAKNDDKNSKRNAQQMVNKKKNRADFGLSQTLFVRTQQSMKNTLVSKIRSFQSEASN